MRSCVNCKHSRDVGPYLACYAQKNAPKVDWDYVCEEWKPEYATNADRIRAMSDEELAMIICCQDSRQGDECYQADCKECLLEWLKQEVDDG